MQKAQEVLLRLIFAEFFRINSRHFSILKHLVYGGADGELAASLRYLSQRFTMPDSVTKGILNDIGTEELAHLEIIGSICYQLLNCAETRELAEEYADAYVEHGKGVYPQNAAGVPFTAAYLQSKGDPIVDLTEDLAAEQKARKTYEYLIKMCDDPDVLDPLRFLREREIVHYQRFGEALGKVQECLSDKNKFFMGMKDK